jgi:hypothetical protein
VAASLAIWSTGSRRGWEAPACAVAGNLPDFDRNVAKRLGVKGRAHHLWPSHSFIGWFPPTVVAARLGGRRPAVRRLLACVWVHLLLDSYADGIAWLWPVHREKIGLFQKPEWIHDDGWRTPAPLSTNMGRLEAAFWLAAALGAARPR